MPIIYVATSPMDIAGFLESGRSVTDEVLAQIKSLLEPPKSPAQQIREQLESEGMTVKQMLGRSCQNYANCNRLTPIEARRREVERAAVLVREREPVEYEHDAVNNVSAYYNVLNMFCTVQTVLPNIADFYMQSAAQWHLLRDVIGDEGLRELIQK